MLESGHAGAVGFVGLGKMGLPMAQNLARAGFPVTAWNRSPRAPSDVEGLVITSDLDEAAAADVVVTMLPDLVEVRAVCDGRLRPGMLIVVMGTVSPVALKVWGGELARIDVAVVDAPVSGGDVGARSGELSIMAGGSDADIARIRPVLQAMGSVVRHLGPLGSGQLAKACNQVVVATTLAALAEAVALGVRGGLHVSALLDVLSGGLAGSRALDVKRAMIESHDFTPGGSAAFQHKDLGFALESARAEGIALPVTAIVDQLFGAMKWTGRGEEDHSGILHIIEILSGIVEPA